MLRVAVIDVGSPKQGNLGWAYEEVDGSFTTGAVGSPKQGNLGWAYEEVDGSFTTGADLDVLLTRLANGLRQSPLALGLESPQFIPLGDAPPDLTSARFGEKKKPWSAAAGATVAMTGLAILIYCLRKLSRDVSGIECFLDWSDPPQQPRQLLLFEAFVSGAAKGKDHIDDAKIAAREFMNRRTRSLYTDVSADRAFSIAGAAMLACGCSTDLKDLHKQSLVVMPEQKVP
jgi:hypothetical protein